MDHFLEEKKFQTHFSIIGKLMIESSNLEFLVATLDRTADLALNDVPLL